MVAVPVACRNALMRTIPRAARDVEPHAACALARPWESSEATLPADGDEGRTVPVRLHARVTEVGTLELWCVTRDARRRWKLEFNVRHPR